MKKLRIIAAILTILLMVLQFSACEQEKDYLEIELGDGLPTWELTQPRHLAELPQDAAEQGLTAIYHTDTSDPDIAIYRETKEGNTTLTEFGQAKAAEHNVFCNMTSDREYETANFVYYPQESDCLTQAYIYEADTQFVQVCVMYKTDELRLADSDLLFLLPKEYTGEEMTDSLFSWETVYASDSEYLPTLTVGRAEKSAFSDKAFDFASLLETEDLPQETSLQEFSLEGIISLFASSHDLLKGELIHRNGFDAAFIGYIENGMFEVKAFIDYGDDVLMIFAEDEAEEFQHVVNALIDTIHTEES